MGSCGRQCGPHSLAYSTSSILPCFGKGLPDFSHCCEISHLAGLFTFRTRFLGISQIAPRSIVSVALSLFFKLRPYSLANRGTLWLARAAFALALCARNKEELIKWLPLATSLLFEARTFLCPSLRNSDRSVLKDPVALLYNKI